MELAIDVYDPLTPAAYTQLAEAVRSGRLADVGDRGFGELGDRHATWRSRELALVLGALIAVGAASVREAETFLLERRRRVALRERRDRRHSTRSFPLERELENLSAGLSAAEGRQLVEGLGHLDLLGARHFADDETVRVDAVGPPRLTFLGPATRHCGVRVIAVDLCELGVVLHVHWAFNPGDADGDRRPLDDEVAPDASEWPLPPDLRLFDSVGTAYRGVVSADEFELAEPPSEQRACDSFVERVAFAPAVPPDAGSLWLASDDDEIRIDLR